MKKLNLGRNKFKLENINKGNFLIYTGTLHCTSNDIEVINC